MNERNKTESNKSGGFSSCVTFRNACFVLFALVLPMHFFLFGDVLNSVAVGKQKNHYYWELFMFVYLVYK